MVLVVETKYPIDSGKVNGALEILSNASLQESAAPMELNGRYYYYYYVDKDTNANEVIKSLVSQPSVIGAYLKPEDHPAL